MLGRALFGSLVAFLLSLALRAEAQSEGVTTTAIVFADEGVRPADETWVTIGLRRGVSEVEGVRYTHLSDAIEPPVVPLEVDDALTGLDDGANAMRSHDLARAQSLLRDAVPIIERNWDSVPRAVLADAYMLRAILECERNRFAQCERGFREVLVFREDLEYDLARYPVAHEERFSRVSAEIQAIGERATFELAVDPVGAEVFVDGRSYGPAPATIPELLVGSHFVTAISSRHTKRLERVQVTAPTTHLDLTLAPSERLLPIDNAEVRIRRELTRSRVERSSAIVGIRGTVSAKQVLFAVVTSEPRALLVQFYLFDLQTQFRLATAQVRTPVGEEAAERVRSAVSNLYRGVDLTGFVAPPPPARAVVEGRETVFEQWWFWTAVGAVVVSGGIVTGIVIAGSDDSGPPEGWQRVSGSIR